MRERGLGGAKDSAAAAHWYRRGAAAGLARARLNLGVLLARGEGVDKNLVEAWALFELAAAQGLDDAATARNRIEPDMSEAQIAEARALARRGGER